MAFLIDSLQYYLMADVLDTKMTGFTAKLEKSTSFEEVKLCHDQFLTEVQTSIFLHNPQVMNRKFCGFNYVVVCCFNKL